MKQPMKISLAIAVLALASAGAPLQSTQNVAGSWDMSVESPQGKRDSLLVIKQEGDKLTGAIKSTRGERALDSVSLNGDEITLVLTIQFQGQDMLITYKGKVENGAMKGDADFGGLASGEWSAVPHKEGAAQPTAAAGAVSAPGSGAANLTGTWNFTVETQAGSGSPTFAIKQDGETLTGTYKGQLGEGPINGTRKGDDVSITVKVNFQGQDFEVLYTGKVNADGTMKGKVKLGDLGEGDWTAKRP